MLPHPPGPANQDVNSMIAIEILSACGQDMKPEIGVSVNLDD